MQHVLLSMVSVLFIVSSSLAAWGQQPPTEFTFRKTNWGMSRDSVRNAEEQKPYKEDDSDLLYVTTVADRKMLVGYFFSSSGLAQARYALLEEHSNKNDYISDYESLKEKLSEKYGRPESDETNWKNDLFKDKPDDYGTAVSVGHLGFRDTWQSKTTEITLKLYGDNYEIHLTTNYFSKIFGPGFLREQQEKHQDEF